MFERSASQVAGMTGQESRVLGVRTTKCTNRIAAQPAGAFRHCRWAKRMTHSDVQRLPGWRSATRTNRRAEGEIVRGTRFAQN